jgi:type II secretory pathway pseudopilin PulG
MTCARWPQRHLDYPPRKRGFTLVELMVAVTGGLFVSVIVFAMARQGTRFYQQETRVAEATLAATIGMQRLRADIGRAGYMSTPYIGSTPANSDPNLCMDYSLAANNSSSAGTIKLLRDMRSLQFLEDTTIGGNSDISAASIKPDKIQLSGAYQSADRFIAGVLQPNAGMLDVPLQPNIGAMARYKYLTLTDDQKTNLMTSFFPSGRLLRLVNDYGRIAYGLISSASRNGDATGLLPTIKLLALPAIPLQGGASTVCTFAGVGVEVNVVNFYQYRIADLRNDACTTKGSLGQLYASTANPADLNRTELVREELDPVTGDPFKDACPEIVAEYAVDLKFEVTARKLTDPTVLLATTPDTTDKVYDYHITLGKDYRPQRIRSVRARLSVRSREADRTANVPSAMTGLYRIGVGTDHKLFARVRTLQAEIAVPNHFGVN